MDIIHDYNLLGIAIGVSTFLVIGMFHPIVIKSEYHFGTKCWWWFLTLGILCIGLSIVTPSIYLSTLFGVVAFSSFWSIKELFEQEERVKKGWFPKNPRRKNIKNLRNSCPKKPLN